MTSDPSAQIQHFIFKLHISSSAVLGDLNRDVSRLRKDIESVSERTLSSKSLRLEGIKSIRCSNRNKEDLNKKTRSYADYPLKTGVKLEQKDEEEMVLTSPGSKSISPVKRSSCGPPPIMPQVSFATPSPCLTLLSLLDRLLPSLPPTVQDVDVPPLFRERFILAGYRPTGQPWRSYALSLFQMHNDTLNVWSPLLAAVCMALRFMMFAILRGGGPEGQGISVDVSSLPLVLYMFSAVTHLSCRAAAHLLHAHSEQAHRSLFLLDFVGVATYQYGCALALSLYSAAGGWTQSMLGKIFLPASALLLWFSCAVCCYTKLHLRRPHRKLCQLASMGAASWLVLSPVAHRLAAHSWRGSPALLHLLQVVLFLLSAFFFSCPAPECFSPGRFDIIGHGHQLSHFLLSLCTLAQQEALFQDFLWRRPALVRDFGEERLLLACASFPCVILTCGMMAVAVSRGARAQNESEPE
ncbi:membrane progestin receptor beta-like [Leuresthes tenuis]|uniref:membrane progestin receptor beta-like n=1 Tax=Leuresthes tenuis TaxID=355514 RepID=UPI003B5134D4